MRIKTFQGRSLEEIRKVAEDERICATTAAERLRRAGLPAPVVSVGSTRTLFFARLVIRSCALDVEKSITARYPVSRGPSGMM